MAYSADTYRAAAQEHAGTALELHNTGRYGPAHYWAGLAVECMLRAYRTRRDAAFDGRHDLAELVRQSAFYTFIMEDEVEQITIAITEVRLRWSNDHRYRPARMIEQWLRDRRVDWRVKGDRLKASSATVTNAALLIVQVGVARWTHKS